MFDIGWTELIVIACVAILVVGPKDLPGMLRNVGKAIRSLRKMTGDFQRQFDEALKEAELDDVANIAKSKSFQPLEDAKKSMEAYQKKVSAELNGKSVETPAESKEPSTGAGPVSRTTAKKAAKKSVAKKPTVRKTAAKKPAVKKSTAKSPAKKQSPAKKPVTKKPVTRKPATKKAGATTTAKAKAPARKPKATNAATGTSA